MTDASDRPLERAAEIDPMPGGVDEPLAAIDATAVADHDAPASVAAPAAPAIASDPGDVSLLGLIDRLGSILERSDLTEIEVGAGRTTVIIRKPAAILLAPAAIPVGSSGDGHSSVPAAPPPGAPGREGTQPAGKAGAEARPSVKAPLTGIWYASPTPGSAPFVELGGELAVGQVVGLIEAMKLFNEIKSDLAGRVVRVVPDSGTLVKAKQPLIEVEPL